MAPVDGQSVVPAGPQTTGGPGTIPLSVLIDYSVQRTYHELTILSELLPRKTDMERKIEIVQFASRTRQLFVRLLALVKWANSAGKVDKCGMISSFLDQQAMLFVDTADMLARMARETLVHARLPSFSLPSAIDVLTTGTYPRLPACIKECIVPPDPITPHEKRQTLMRLNQIIEHRLVTSDLPPLMRRLKIENGRVKFYIEHEFQVTLTLMGDGATIPWRLLDIEILVEDPETGDGKALVHSLQVNYIHQLVQTRLIESEKPLYDLYNCLHSFSQSLQLEVLHSQAQRLIHQRLGEHIRIEDYTAGKCLVLSYWRDPSRRDGRLFPATNFKLSIHVDEQEPSKPLQITHFPQIQGSENIKVAQAIRSDHLSIEKLLVHTVQVRSTARLKDLERELRCITPGPSEIRDLPSVLYVPILFPCLDSEKLCIAVDIQKGTFLISIAETETDLTEDIEESLNGDRRDLRRLLSRLRLKLGLQRCEKSVQHLGVVCQEQLPLINLSGHPLEKLGHHKYYVRLPKQTAYYLVVEVYEIGDKSVGYNHYLLHVSADTFEPLGGESMDDVPQAYLRAGHLVQLDTYICTHGSCSKLHDPAEEDPNPLHRKRKLLLGDIHEPPSKKPRVTSPYFVPELTHILALCEDRIPFVLLGKELNKRGLTHQGIQVDGDGAGMALTLIDILPCPGLDAEAQETLRRDLLSCKFRIQRKSSRIWLVEAIFSHCPVKSTNPKEHGPVHRVYFGYDLSGMEAMDKIVQNFFDDWNSVAHLYAAVQDFAQVYKDDAAFQNYLEIKTFTYKRLTLAYGHNKCYTVTVQYRTTDKQFNLSFGSCGPSNMSNCHTIMATQLQWLLNQTGSISQVAQVLIDTWAPLTAVGKLNICPMLGLTSRPNVPGTEFTVLPQSPTHVRVVFRNLYCIDIHCRGNQIVAIRDGAYSMFDTSKVVEGLTPIPGLKAFLNLYIDETVSMSHARRRSATEDDNPPSPMGMDTMDSFMSQQPSTGSPASRQKDGLRFHNPMTPPSNPHTPASPRMAQQMVAPSPSAVLMGTPSPANVLAQGSPNNPALHVPSPSSFVPAPSPSSLGIHMSPAASFISPQGMVEGGGSPFPSTSLTMPSPGPRNWPGSPSVPGPSPASRHVAHSPGHPALHSPQTGHGSVMSPPSRILPPRSWAASIPTLLSHDALNKLMTPGPIPGIGSNNHAQCCPLERFLGCVVLRRQIQRVVQTEEALQAVQSNEPGVILFKVQSLQFRVSLHPQFLQSLHLEAKPLQDSVTQWDQEDLQILEKFFEVKVANVPYKPNTMTAFGRLLGAPPHVLKDCIKIMRLELEPERNLKWSVQWCLTVPHGTQIAMAGTPAVVIKGKILFMLQLQRLGVPAPSGSESQTIVVPILYDVTTNVTTMPEQRAPNAAPPSQANIAVTNMLKRFADFNRNSSVNECSIYPAVKELLTNLVVPI